ncbi:hypothetical protein [Sphingomonas sp. OTU376]|uniref:hypothetical protein n=1 Tax=Sphingomonas sp. OTU376 TaxID=3043863 RepID=UPI00313CFC1A
MQIGIESDLATLPLAASFFAGSLLHSSGWATINWFVLPAVALVLVALVWRAARTPTRKAHFA